MTINVLERHPLPSLAEVRSRWWAPVGVAGSSDNGLCHFVIRRPHHAGWCAAGVPDQGTARH